jgi:hypothetical protein
VPAVLAGDRAVPTGRGAVRDGGHHGHQHDDQEHAQVLEDGDHAIVGPEVARHGDDPRGAPGDHGERPGDRADPALQPEQEARAQAERQGRQRHQQDRQPVPGHGAQRLQVHEGAHGHPDDRLPGGHRRPGHPHAAGEAQSTHQSRHEPAEECGRGNTDGGEREAGRDRTGDDGGLVQQLPSSLSHPVTLPG